MFELEVDPATGAFTFALHDQLDHVAPPAGTANENSLSIDFGAALQATDFDGDAIPLTGKVTVTVTDDVPVLLDAPAVVLTVDEDDIETAGSAGSAPDDGNLVDGSFTGPGGVDTQGPANATSGSLAGLVVAPGADDPLTFGFVSEADVRALLTAQNLSSEGAALSYDLSADGTTLYGFVNAGAPGADLQCRPGPPGVRARGRPGDGGLHLSLHDQLDHVAPPAGTANENSLSIDFGSALQATDFDGDFIPLTGKVTVNVTDDIPVLTGTAASITVDEDDIETAGSAGSAPDDGDAVDGSFTGPGGVDTQGPANATSGSLAGLVVAPGADDPLTFGFVSEADVRALLTAQNLNSEGAALSYDLSADGTTLYGFVNAGAPAA